MALPPVTAQGVPSITRRQIHGSIRLEVLDHPDGVNLLSVSYPPGEAALVWEISSGGNYAETVRISYLLRNIDRLISMIDNLLVFSRQEAELGRLHLARFPLAPLVSDAIELLREEASPRQLARLGAGVNPEAMHAERVDGYNPLAVAEAIAARCRAAG
mgnify:CR=1 FL=1